MIKIVKASSLTQFEIIENLAKEIWTEHYTPIIGCEQVEYMLEKFQSQQAIESQIDDGYEYFLIETNDSSIGYLGVKQEKDALFLSKIYLHASFRGQGLGKAALLFVESHAKSYGLDKIRLTVNKNNTDSIKAYINVGFVQRDSVVIDIGGGYVMDDYVLEKNLE
ncbi:GNAT family N-acetyltransferase [Reichenbachiella sp. MALMAid0571]|uniref:GNAT family N-acetyltransferase n=1 Tax=Reichenbachiella sp. MALMAid0571 TaxID=3143939 RepID=UPI0032DF26C2